MSTLFRGVSHGDRAADPRPTSLSAVSQWTGFFAMSAIWGSSYFFLKIASRLFDPFGLVTLRMLVAAIALAVVVSWRRLWRRLPGRTWAGLALLALVNITIPFTMLTWAQQYVASSITAVLSSTTPLFVFLVVCFVLAEERASWLQGLCTLACLGGIYLLSGGGPGHSSPIAEIVIVGSSAVFAAGNVLGRRVMRGVHPLLAAWGQSTIAFLLETPLALGWGRLPASWTSPASLAVLWLGAIGTGVAYWLYFHFIQTWGSTRTSWNTYLQPIVGITLGIAILGEVLTVRAVLGIVVVIAGVVALAATRRGTRSRVSNAVQFPTDTH